MTLVLGAKLDRTDSKTPWGFRLYGGKDFGSPFTVQRVTPGSLADKCGLEVGDVILKIANEVSDTLRHKEAEQRIIHSGNSLELTLQRGNAKSPLVQNATPPPARPAPAPAPSVFSPAMSNGAPPAPSVFSDHNRSARPFSAVANNGELLVTNEQFNSPLSLYSVDNAVETMTQQIDVLNVAPAPVPASPRVAPSPAGPTSPPWGSPPPAVAAAPAPAPPSAWVPKVPSGPRTMKNIQAGEAKSMPAGSAVGRVPICAFCGIAIRGPFVSALEKTWCPNHFNCANPQCSKPLINCGFVEEEGQLLCENDYDQFLAPKCAKCSKSIMRECVNALGRQYHPECFLCHHCGVAIGSGAFHMEDSNNYCEKDWQAMFQTKCFGCQFPIESGDRWVEALDQNWHSECFNCSTCQVNLEGQGFFAKGGKPYCKKHAANKRF